MLGDKLKSMALRTALQARLPEGVRVEELQLDRDARRLDLRLRVDRVDRSFDLHLLDYSLHGGRLAWRAIEIDRGDLELPPEAVRALSFLL